MANTTTSSGGVGFFGLLTIVFIVLKLTGFIDWSWIWVFMPIWIISGIAVAIDLLVGIGWLAIKAIEALDGLIRAKRRRLMDGEENDKDQRKETK